MKMKWVNGYRMKLILLGFVSALTLNGGSVNADFTFGESTNLVFLLNMAMTCGAAAQVSFTRILEGDIAQDTGFSAGCAWGDYDNDGYPDLLVADAFGRLNRLYHNNGDGTFSRNADGPIVNDPSDTSTGVWGDYDNDGDLDLFVTNFDPPRDCFYRNEGDGHFTKVTQGAWVTDGAAGTSAAWVDYDNDGLLDLFVANSNNQNNYLYRNNGDGTMSKINNGPVVSSDGSSHGCTWSDYNGDGDVDLFVACGHGENEQHFRNNGDGTFTRITGGIIVISGGDDNGITSADYDNDGDLDVLVTSFESNRLYQNNGWEGFSLVMASGIEKERGASQNAAWGDYDNDGDLDLFIANACQRGATQGENNFLYRNNGDGTFFRLTEGAGVNDGGHSWGCACSDYDNDGDLDLFVANGLNPSGGNPPPEPGFLYRNDGSTNNWLLLRLVGVASNRSAIGAKVRIFATIQGESFWQLREVSGGSGYCSQNDLSVHFGLGDATTVESMRIEWPSGITQFLRDIAVNQLLTVEEEDPTGNNTAPRITPSSPDFNGDGIVDSIDMCMLVEHWQTDDPLCDIAPPPYGDGTVDVQDLIELAEHLFEEILPSGLLAYWKLDEAEGDIAFNSVSDNQGLLSGSPVWQPETGKIDGALELDGIDDYIDAGFVLNPADGPFSVSAWIKGGAPGQVIISQTDGTGTGEIWLGADSSAGKLMTGLVPPPAGRSVPQPLKSETIVTDGLWHHAAFVWDSGYRILYVDGTEVARDTAVRNPLKSATGGMIIGAGKNLDSGTFFSGLIDDVRIYNVALITDEIATLSK